MKITCQSCQSKYTVSDEKVQGRTVKIKCRKCGATILVNSTGAGNGGIADPESVVASPSDGSTYLVNVGDGDQRSMSLAELIAGYGSGVITADTYVWADGMTDWQPLGQVETIVAALTGAAAPPARSASQEASGYGASAAAQPSYGDTAAPPSTSAESTSGMHRAAVRRDPARPSQDLFGSSGTAQEPQRLSADDVATSAPLFSKKSSTAGRDENSMLFSLSALTAKTGASPPAASSSTGPKDDSGLIDLKALSASGKAPSPAAAIGPEDGGLFQLSAPIAGSTAAPSVAPIAMPAQKNRGALYIAVGIAVAGLAIAGVLVGTQGGDAPPAPVPTSDVAQVAAPVPSPTIPEPTPKAVDPGATAAATATATPTATSVTAKPQVSRPVSTRTSGTPPSGTKPPTTSTPAPTTPKPRSGGNCGCAPSDLMCNMQCSAKGK